MRVAFVGKGGSGKSVIVGTLARLLARRGEPTLVLDSDVLPGIAFSLGAEPTDARLPDDLVEENPDGDGPRFRLRRGLTPAAAVERHAFEAPDGVRLLQLGKLGGDQDALGRAHWAFRRIAAGLDRGDGGWHVVGDLPGGTRQPFFGWGEYADTIVIVVEPTAKSMLSARRLGRVRTTTWTPRIVAVANKVRGPADADEIAARTRLDVIGAIPEDDAVGQADRLGTAPLDHAPDAPAVEAIGSLLDQLVDDGEAVPA